MTPLALLKYDIVQDLNRSCPAVSYKINLMSFVTSCPFSSIFISYSNVFTSTPIV